MEAVFQALLGSVEFKSQPVSDLWTFLIKLEQKSVFMTFEMEEAACEGFFFVCCSFLFATLRECCQFVHIEIQQITFRNDPVVSFYASVPLMELKGRS